MLYLFLLRLFIVIIMGMAGWVFQPFNFSRIDSAICGLTVGILVVIIESSLRKISTNQLFARKSIDKLISDSERPETRLKKTLGKWGLTALGIGAIIGSGIFVLTGTAAAGEHFEVDSIYHAQVMDLIANLFQYGNT